MPPPVLTLPKDVTEDVLLRLPTKCLVRFRLVSSFWRSLISDPIFKKIHFNSSVFSRSFQNPNSSSQRVLLLTSTRLMLLDPHKKFSGGGGALVNLRSPLAGEDRRLRIVGSCNSFVCLGIADYRDLFIWNPSTGDCHKLPEPSTPIGKSYAPGFGYDSLSDDYKVVLVTYYNKTFMDSQGKEYNFSSYHMVAIYSLKTNSWRIIEQFNQALRSFYRLDMEYFPESTFLNGAIHWRSITCSGDDTITAFNVSKETFYSVPYPRFIRFRVKGLGVLDGCLCLVRAVERRFYGFELWLMKDYGVEASWTKLISLRYICDTGNKGEYEYSYEPLCASGDNTFILIRNAKELIRFNDKGRTIEKVCISDESDKCEGVAFIESIFSG